MVQKLSQKLHFVYISGLYCGLVLKIAKDGGQSLTTTQRCRPITGDKAEVKNSPLGTLSNSQGSSGWGKQAAKRFDTSEVFKKDPLLKSLEGKIAVGFGDYKPWQRTSIPRNAIPAKPSAPKTSRKESNRPLSSRMTRSSYSAGGVSKAAEYERAY